MCACVHEFLYTRTRIYTYATAIHQCNYVTGNEGADFKFKTEFGYIRVTVSGSSFDGKTSWMCVSTACKFITIIIAEGMK